MKNIFISAALSLLGLCLCSCGDGANNTAGDCINKVESVQTTTGKTAGAAALAAIPSGESSYTIQGTDLDGVAGIQIELTYDATSLGTPTVTQGALAAGSMFVANTSLPGLIKIAIISTRSFSGSGGIATVSFASKTGTGGITLISTTMINSQGSPIAASGSTSATGTAVPEPFTLPAVPFSQPTQLQGVAAHIHPCLSIAKNLNIQDRWSIVKFQQLQEMTGYMQDQ